MALTEPQILRYSRQILLRDVGGVGQERLLATRVQLAGGGRALASAAAYLAGGGSVIDARERPLTPDDAGFLLGAELADDGRPARAELQGAAAGMNPDAAERPTSTTIALVAAPERAPTAPAVTIGADADAAVVLVAAAQACPRCLALNGVDAPPAGGALGVAAGTLAATLVQRLALGLEPPGAIQRLLLRADGTLERGHVARCEACRP